ncbi:MAG TPA: hypothetical protein VNA69_21555 [Thermoanaerobaculia bacterium]|nr:hypothetical protein [Thermoanaerobaculia bacterium]
MTTVSSLVLDTARRGELHHAIILWGPSAALLRDLASRIAKTINCTNGSTGDDCMSCDRIERRIHPDVHFIEVGGERKLISVEQVREILAGAVMRPFEGRGKVFIIDPADALSVSGSNSLLKTLEEPASDTTFILLTRSPDLLLPTIKSRAQQIYVGAARATRIQQRALLDDGDKLASDITDLLHRFATRGESAALLALAALVSNHDDVKDAIALLGAILCDAATLDSKELAEIRERIPREKLLAAADNAMAAIRWLTVNADPRMLAETVVAALV